MGNVFISMAVIFVGTSFSAYAQLQNPEKVGIGTWESDSLGTSLTNVENFGFGWYYDWRTDHLYSPSSTAKRTVEFVPMIWDETHVNETPPRESGVLLGFNEPDLSSQAGMSVDQAISLWPKLMATGLRLGSPAPTTNQAMGSSSWLGQFMSKADALGYRVDFIAVHYYSANKDVNAFKIYLDNLYATYKKPIWVTEWALVDWNNPGRYTYAETAAYAKEALVMLDQHPHVERHAWFAALPNHEGLNTYLFDANNKITPVGQVFYDALRGGELPLPEPPDPVGNNLVANPGFENSGLAGWENWGNSSAVSGGAEGSYSARTGTGAGGVAQNLIGKIITGKTYRLQTSAKLGAATDQGWVGIKFIGSGGAVLLEKSVPVLSTNYTVHTVDVIAPSGAAAVYVFSWKNAGTSYLTVDSFSLSEVGETVTPSVDTIAPIATLTSPASGTSVSRRTKLTLTASASDNVAVTRVEFYANGKKVCSDTTIPYSCSWAAPRKRTSVDLQVKAYDAAGNIGSSALATLFVE